MKTYTVYIGADNKTKVLEVQRIKDIAGNRHEGFTIYEATGHWLGTEEKTAILTISDEPAKVLKTIEQLKADLHQDAIGYQVAPTMQFA